MQAQVRMTNIQYNHAVRLVKEGFLPVKKVDVGEELRPVAQNKWVIPTHYRHYAGDRVRQVGIRFSEALQSGDQVIIHDAQEKQGILLKYEAELDIWYQPTLFSPIKKGKTYQFAENNVIVGMTNAGTVMVTVVREQQVLHRLQLHFVPAAIKIEDYEEMVADLFRIREQLVRDDRNPAEMAIRQQKTFMALEQQLEQLQQAIKRMNRQPHKQLRLTTTKRKKRDGDRFDLRAELEAYISPGQPKYTHRHMEETTATYENALMKQLLEDLRKYAELQSTTSVSKQLDVEQQALFAKSDLFRVMHSLSQLADEEEMQRIKHELQQTVDRFSAEEQMIREQTVNHARYEQTMPSLNGLYYVEVTLGITGMPASVHEQSAYGMRARISYDNSQRAVTVRNYLWQTIYGEERNERIIGHFGEVVLTSTYAAPHLLLYRALHDARLTHNERHTIVIRGYVHPRENDLDPVKATNPNNDRFPKYSFDYQWITEILIDGQRVTAPQTRPELQAFLTEELPVRMRDVDAAESAEMRQMQFQQLVALEQEKKRSANVAANYTRLIETVDECLKLPLFKQIERHERLVSEPTQLFLHDPNYKAAWLAVRAIEQEISASLYATVSDTTIKTAKVEQLFEVWVLYKMLALMTQQMGWTLDGKHVVQTLDHYLIANETLKDFNVTLTHGAWTLECFYEPRIDLVNGNYLTPDFVFRYSERGLARGLVILDAKYRDYTLQQNGQWKRDVERIAMEKYGNMSPRDAEWRLPILHSGIIHCDASISQYGEGQFNPYHVLYNEHLFERNMTEDTSHRYGSIYMLPSQLHVFKNWFRMIFEYHLKRYDTCWHCGEETDIVVRPLVTRSGYPKYHYSCKTCHEFWVKVHCSHAHHHLVKHTFNYHLQVYEKQRWYVVCPCCNDGRPMDQRYEPFEHWF